MSSIFLSYRRADSIGWAGRLNDSLRRLLPDVRLFMDVEDIPIGVDFEEFIGTAVARCDLLIALIGPEWADERDEKGQRRLDAPIDYTRTEIKAALDRNIRVVPVLVGGARMPSVADLPESLKPLAKRQNFELSDRGWEEGCQRLARAIEQALPSPQPTPAIGKAASKVGLPVAIGAAIVVAAIGVTLFVNQYGAGRDNAVGKPVTPDPAEKPVVPPAPSPQVPAPNNPPASVPPTLLDLGLEGNWRVDGERGVFRVQRAGRDLRLMYVRDEREESVAVVTVNDALMRVEGDGVVLTARPRPPSAGEWLVTFTADTDCPAGTGTVHVSPDAHSWLADLTCPGAKPPMMVIRAELAADRNAIQVSVGEAGRKPESVTIQRVR